MDNRFHTGSVGTTRKTASRSSGVGPVASRGKHADDRLRKACSDFEGIFLNLMVQTMKKTVPGGGVLGKSHQSEVFDAMFFQEISSKLARERGLGIGEALYRQARRQMIETAGK